MALESKEKIKDRMLKTAAKLWGMPDVEVESSFDPIVKLMLDACSYELEKINGDMEASNSRMIEKMVEVILPDALIGIRPSSAIVYAQSSDKDYLIPNKKHFIAQKRVLNPQTNIVETIPLTYSAIGNFTVRNASIKYLSSGTKLYQVKDNWYKDVILQSQGNSLTNCIWLGIELKDATQPLKNLTLFFDSRSEQKKELFYHSLRQTEISHQGKAVSCKPGMAEEDQFTQLDISDLSENMFQYNKKTCNHIYRLYQKHYLTTHPDSVLSTQNTFPDELSQLFSEQELKQKMPLPLLWLKVEFNSGIHQDLLDSVFCQINCIPVINRKQYELSYKTQKYINIIPIESKEYFFDIKSIIGGNNHPYHKRNLSTSQELNAGEAIVRSSGVGRFDSREARDTIHFLLQVIRDETSTFSEIGGETIAAKMKELNQVISRIEDQMKKFQKSGSSCYIMLKPRQENETIFVEYWSCSGKQANDIKIGTKLTQEKGSELINNSLVFLSPTLGGKDKLNFEEKLNLFRKYLMAKDRIVSAEDIRIICFQLFGQALSKVEIEKNVMQGFGPSEGYTRCIDVNIQLKENHSMAEDEVEYLLNDLSVQLNHDSISLFPYRVKRMETV